MKKTILLLAVALWGALPATHAQWLEQTAGFTIPGLAVTDISAPSGQVAWAIAVDLSPQSSVANQEFIKTTDGGVSWQLGQVTGISGYNFSDVHALNDMTAWVAMYVASSSTGGGKVMKTTDGGQTWTDQTLTAFQAPSGFPNAVYFFDASNGVALGNPNGGTWEFYTTANGGTAWNRVPAANLPAPQTNEFGRPAMYSVSGNTIWFGTTKGRILRSTDQGLTWTEHPTGLSNMDVVEFRDSQNGLAKYQGSLRRTTDGGQTWNTVSTAGKLHRFDIAYVPGTASTYVSTGADLVQGDLGSSYSTDDGQTWISIDDSTLHTAVKFFSPTDGWSGGFNQSAQLGGIFRWAGNPVQVAEQVQPEAAWQVYPNPSSGTFRLQLEAAEAPLQLQVTDVTGRMILTQTIPAASARAAAAISLPQVAPGLYTLQVWLGEKVFRQKLLVQP